MADLANRVRFSSTMSISLAGKLKELSDKTRISQSKLMDEAIEDLLKKYNEKGQS